MKAKGRGGARPGAGRPKGSGPGRIEGRFSVKCSPEYKVWLGALAEKLGGTEADVFRKALETLAEKVGFRPPPLR